MKGYHYVGLDVHKKTIAYCVKEADGTVLDRAGVTSVSKLPSREELIASIAGCIGAPGSNIAGAIGAPASNIASILSTIEERAEAA